jgi:hypothetical protein
MLGMSSVGFAAGFALEFASLQLGLPSWCLLAADLFEAGALLGLLYVFFELSLEDVPHFQHLVDSARHRARHASSAKPTPLPHHLMPAEKKKSIKKRASKSRRSKRR